VTDTRSSPRRVLVLSRLFSGLKAGLSSGQWKPRGVPAFYHLLEGLAEDPDMELLTVFTAKDNDERFRRVNRRTIEPIGDTVVLPRRAWLGPRFGWMNTLLTEIEQTIRIVYLLFRYRPDLIYASYANIVQAGLLARFTTVPVVLRLLGVVPQHRDVRTGRWPVYRWLLRSPFRYVVSTEDGSDPAAILPDLLHELTPWSVRVNGCDAAPLGAQEKDSFLKADGWGERPLIAFLGRLEKEKGCLVFIDAVLDLLQHMPDAADIVVVGDGPLRTQMEASVEAKGQSARVRFTGALPHREAYRHVAAADIYVSTNMYGNLSNANLEAIAVGVCVVLPTSDPAIPLDTSTDRLITDDVALRYDRNRLPDSMCEALTKLLNSPREIEERRAQTRALSKTLIRPWSESVVEDISALKSLNTQI
jgi:glycosyltransferase involved in cell wall biosynthesis